MIRQALLCAGAVLAAWSVSAQQGNPFEADPTAVKTGASLFAARCADCHGPDAKGVRGPDLTTLWMRGATDERVFAAIRRGVAGTIMPPSTAPDTELWALVAHLRSISTVPPLVTTGNPALGRALFAERCAACHRAGAAGPGGIGPDLSRITLARSREALVRSMREPNAVVADGFRSITLHARGGEPLRGVLKHEDAFSIQIATEDGRLLAFRTGDLADIARTLESPMPPFGADRIGDTDVENLLAFLAASAEAGAASVSTAKGSQ